MGDPIIGYGLDVGWQGMLFVWLLIVAIAFVVVRWLLCTWVPRDRSALEILKDRYARGEIERDEFIQRKRDLSE